MLEKLKNLDKIKKIILISIISLMAIILFFLLKPSIKFNEDFEVIEYGSKYEYKNMIKSINPKDAEIIYPEFQATEVGNYDLTFTIKKGDKTYSKNFKFKIQDTEKPKLNLFYLNDSIKVRLNRKSYNVLENVSQYKYISKEAMKNIHKLTYDEYTKLIEDVNKASKEINDRVIKNKDDIKKIDVMNNGIFYVDTVDLKTPGFYPIHLCVIDENYNYVETMWQVEVVDSEEMLTSGGQVTCTYKGDDLNKGKEYSIHSYEKYTYNPFKLITHYELLTEMAFSDDYYTKDNISLMMKQLNKNYGKYDDIKGVSVKITNKKNVVTTSIKVDLSKYDKIKDEMEILKFDVESEIDVNKIMKQAGDNNYVCTFK